MPTRATTFVPDLTASTGVLYLNGAIPQNPRAWWYFVRQGPKMLRAVRAAEGCLQAKSAMAGPREFLMYSYWESHEALRAFYRSTLHVSLMRTTFQNPDWYVLYNETYDLPVSTRYWNAANGYALTQPLEAIDAADLAPMAAAYVDTLGHEMPPTPEA